MSPKRGGVRADFRRDAELEQLYRDVQAVADEGMKKADAQTV